MNGKYNELHQVLAPFLKTNVAKRRNKSKHDFDPSLPFGYDTLAIVQRYLHRMPRQVFQSNERRASVLIPLCNANGKPSVLFERRSALVRTHKLEVWGNGCVCVCVCVCVIANFRYTDIHIFIPTLIGMLSWWYG